MRYTLPLLIALSFCLAAQPASAQFRLLEAAYWQFHGPIESIEEREYKYDYKADAIATEAERSRIYRFDDRGRLETIEGTDPYGKTTYTLRYDDAGRLSLLRREREVEGKRKFGEERSGQRDDQGEITGLAVADFVGIVALKLQRKVENEAEGDRRMIKTYKPQEDGGDPDRLYLIEKNQLRAILYYGAYSDPNRVSKTKRFNAKGLLVQSLSYSARDEPKQVTNRDN